MAEYFAWKEEELGPLIVSVNGKKVDASCVVKIKRASHLRPDGSIEVPRQRQIYPKKCTRRAHFIHIETITLDPRKWDHTFVPDYNAVIRQKKLCDQLGLPFVPIVSSFGEEITRRKAEIRQKVKDRRGLTEKLEEVTLPEGYSFAKIARSEQSKHFIGPRQSLRKWAMIRAKAGKPGRKPGFKQSPESIAKRVKSFYKTIAARNK